MKLTRRATVINQIKCSTNFLLILTIILQLSSPGEGHGRLIEPPSRASAWRYGFNTPANYNDHELFCGGFTKQHQGNGGKCGECGDDYSLPIPRPHEYGGKYGQGITVRKYNPGTVMTIRVELTASHMGYFEFRLCDDINARQKCLDKNLLKIISGSPFISFPNDLSTRFYPRNGSRIYEIKAQLPKELECEHCVLQWKYIAGNNWGMCTDGNGAVGCGPQEEFRACSDVAIGKGAVSSIPTLKPPVKIKTTTPKRPTDDESDNEIDHDHEDTELEATEDANNKPTPVSNFYGAIIAIFTFFLVLLTIIAIYIYFYHGDFLKQLLRRQRNSQNQQKVPLDTASSISSVTSSDMSPPMRPPRTKRLSQTLKDIPHHHSSILGSEKNVV
ncbi:hypothetical protein PVAND_011142 [Polypedilum vanderplanki]|uniref:Chitin-binding type-4 domain-containing protein n=1 Tax=Polypedilum vanderplanki TaxID=319348 RepID=A0A9J6CIE6_POLVA|nr:hypothetical protein PVAND_011142 [Polypedilum vanderplanki]